MHYTTLNDIRAKHPCATGWSKLLAHLGKTQADAEPLALATILEANGIEDAVWALRALPADAAREIRLFAVSCARQVQHLMTDPRSLKALDVTERFANGDATANELEEAHRAAAAAVAYAAADAAACAAYAAPADAAADAAYAAAYAAADAADARAAACEKQTELFKQFFCN